jgi:hypothetical protein
MLSLHASFRFKNLLVYIFPLSRSLFFSIWLASTQVGVRRAAFLALARALSACAPVAMTAEFSEDDLVSLCAWLLPAATDPARVAAAASSASSTATTASSSSFLPYSSMANASALRVGGEPDAHVRTLAGACAGAVQAVIECALTMDVGGGQGSGSGSGSLHMGGGSMPLLAGSGGGAGGSGYVSVSDALRLPGMTAVRTHLS